MSVGSRIWAMGLAGGLAGVLAFAGACGNSSSNPDAGSGDGDGGVDPTGGLRLQLGADPEPTGDFDGDFNPTLDAVEISLTDFRAIGDSAPGDERTSEPSLTLTFAGGEGHVVQFAGAPVGRYSRIRARLDRFVASGTLEVSGDDKTWTIDDTPPGGVEIEVDFDPPVDLGAGVEVEIDIEVRLDRPYDDVDWDDVGEETDLVVDGTFRGIDGVRSKFREMFRLND